MIIFSYYSFSTTLKLKSQIQTDKSDIYLYDIIEDSFINIPNIKICRLNSNEEIIKNRQVMDSLFKNNIYDITLTGKDVTVIYGKNNIEKSTLFPEKQILTDTLEDYFSKF